MMENEKKRFVEQELNSDDYKRAVNGAKALKQLGALGSVLTAAGLVVVKVTPKLIKSLKGLN